MNKLVISMSIALSSLALPNLAQALTWQEVSQGYKTQLLDLGVVGGAIALINRDQSKNTLYFGLADRQNASAITEKTLFHWASITKTFTGIAIMQLRDRHKLKLSDPVVKYLPEIAKVYNPYANTHEITIKHLLSHSAGFRASSFPFKTHDWQPHEPTDFAQLTAMMPYSKIQFEPGSKYSYSNLGINFLGEVVKRITGDDIEVYIDKNIFKPLKMYDAYFDSTPYHLQKYRSNNYYFKNKEFHAGGPEFDTGVTTANGGINASIEDMTKYVAFLIGDTANAAYEGILSRSSLEEMWQPQHSTQKSTKKDERIGLTFFSRTLENQQFVGHTGSQKNFYSSLFVNPTSKTGHLFVYNTSKIVTQANGKRMALTMPIYHHTQLQLFELMAK
ncbi:beta-lactamase family protein [Pseudoalteromonas luteoviolacea]|uniref:serine hydrolase domain-containing protein n=1 Tax=Pseudoalteromonas luteoviolacea TaxID=43657 RepID=UPI001B385AA6|nr:serine hydrolase domain-containing protein [Pseudoalteromonas luteoviolacea]MBQ4810229.1 beta-lactamase family protein [Pseudoalteromonas luteoviolacea]